MPGGSGDTNDVWRYRFMPSFKKRHYETIAEVLYGTKPGMYANAGADFAQWERTCLAFLSRFRHDNPRFDGDKFLKACKGEKL